MVYKKTKDQSSACFWFISVNHREEAVWLVTEGSWQKSAQGHSLPSVWFFDSSEFSSVNGRVYLKIPLLDKTQSYTLRDDHESKVPPATNGTSRTALKTQWDSSSMCRGGGKMQWNIQPALYYEALAVTLTVAQLADCHRGNDLCALIYSRYGLSY